MCIEDDNDPPTCMRFVFRHPFNKPVTCIGESFCFHPAQFLPCTDDVIAIYKEYIRFHLSD